MSKLFSDNFWSKNKSGMIQLLDYIKSTHDDLDIVYSIYKKRADLENEFGEKLLVLSTAQELDEPSEQGIAGAYQAIAMELKKTAESHLDLSRKLKKEVSDELEAKLEEYRKLFEKWDKTLNQIYEERQQKTIELLKIRSHYLKEHDALKGQSNTNTKKLKEQYKTMVTEVDELSQEWVESWTEACETMQAMEEDRVEFIKYNVWEYANLSSARLLIQDEWCEVIRTQLEKCSAEEEIEKCISSYGTGSKAPTTNEYVGEVMKDLKKKQEPEERMMGGTIRNKISDNMGSTASRGQIKRKPLNRSLMSKTPEKLREQKEEPKLTETEPKKSLEAILSLQEAKKNKDFHRRQPSEYKPDTGSLPTRRARTINDVSSAPKSPRPTAQTIPEDRNVMQPSNFPQQNFQPYNTQPQYATMDQRSPMMQPQISPMMQPQKSPMMQPQRSPMMQPQKSPMMQPQRSPMMQHSPMVQPMMMQAPISPMMQPQRSPSMAHQASSQNYTSIPPPITIPNYIAPSPQPSPSMMYGASPVIPWPTHYIDGRPILSWARSKYDYKPTDPTEIPLTKNCLVGALESDLSQDSWWTGAVWDEYHQTWSQAGSLPGNFMVKLV